MSYQQLDASQRPKAFLPTTRFDVRDFIFWRSWQGESIVRILYYAHVVLALVVLVWYIVGATMDMGAGGFFLGLLLGLLIAVFIILHSRVVCELVLSVFSIRDNMERVASFGGQGAPTASLLGSQKVPQPHQPYQSL